MKSATINAEKAPRLRQSRVDFGFVKLNAKMMKIAELITASVHRPYAEVVFIAASLHDQFDDYRHGFGDFRDRDA